MTTNVRKHGDAADRDEGPEFAALYGQYHQFVRRALRRHYVDASELEDVTQEVFLVLLRRMDEAARTRSLGGWLYQIARRVAANHRRGAVRRQRKHEHLREAGGVDAAIEQDPEQRYARAEAVTFIREFLESLDEEACAVFVMSEIEGIKGAEIADRLGLTLPMTYARIRAVRARFGRRLERVRHGVFAPLFGSLESSTKVGTVALASSWKLGVGIVVVVGLLVGSLWSHRTSQGPGKTEPAPQLVDRLERGNEGVEDGAAGSLRAGVVYAGLVVDTEDAPIAGALVCGDHPRTAEHRLIDRPACSTTDGQGRFRIESGMRDVHIIEAMANGFLPARFRGRATSDIRIVLHRGGVELTGTVFDVYGGPIEGAWVALENRADLTLGAAVLTDEQGAFTLWVEPGAISLAAGALGYAPAFTAVRAPTKNAQIELGAESVIAGVVVDGETGEPVEHVRVSALMHRGPDTYTNRQGVAYSDAQGRFEIRRLQPAHYVLDAASEQGWGRAPRDVQLGIGDRQDGIRIELRRGTMLQGRIVDAETGEPCDDGSAVTFDPPQTITREARSTEDGLVTITALTGGIVYSVAVECRGYVDQRFDVDLSDPGVREPSDWPLRRGSELTVHLVDGRGEPVQNWDVELRWMGALDFLLSPSRRGATDAEGAVVLRGLRTEPHRLIAHGPGHPSLYREVEVPEGRSELELEVPSGVPVSGTVSGARGALVEGALVVLQSPDPTLDAGFLTPEGERMATDWGPIYATTDATGRFRIDSVAAGSYDVWALPDSAAVGYLSPSDYPGGFRPVASDPLQTIVVQDHALTLALRMAKLESIAGVVRGEDGSPLADIRVFAAREREAPFHDPRGRAQLTDEEGRYRFDDLLVGTYTLTAFRPGGGIARRPGVRAGDRSADIDFPRPASIAGRVVKADGTPLSPYPLGIHGDHPHEPPFVSIGSADGSFVVEDLEPGAYELYVMVDEGVAHQNIVLEPGEKKTGIELRLAPGTGIRGRLVDANGAPVARWAVAMFQGDGVRAVPSGPDGTFSFPEVPPMAGELKALPETDGGPPMPDAFQRAPTLRDVVPKPHETIDLGDVVVARAEP